MELFNRLLNISLIHRVLILLTLILSGPEAVAPQLQTDEITQKSLSDYLTEIDRPTVEVPARNIGKKPKFQIVFVPSSDALFLSEKITDSQLHFTAILKNQFLVSASARGPPLS